MKELLPIVYIMCVVALIVWIFMPQGSGKYTIVAPNGRYSHYYHTNAYVRRDNCIYFLCNGDSVSVCGTYQVR